MVEASAEPTLERGLSGAWGSQVSGLEDGDGWDDYGDEDDIDVDNFEVQELQKTVSEIKSMSTGYRVLFVKSFEKRILDKIEEMLDMYGFDGVDPLIIIARHF